MMKKILFISHRSDLGGGELSLFDLIIKLTQQHLQIFICLSEKGMLYDKLTDLGYNVFIVPMPPIKKLNILSVYKLIKFINKNKINVLHANTTRAAIYCSISKLFTKSKLVWHNRGTDKRGIIEFIVSKFADKLIAISKTVEIQLLNLGVPPKKIKTIYNGIPLDIPKNNIPISKNSKNFSLKKFKLALVGRFTVEKGHFYLIEAARILINNQQKNIFEFVFVGNENFGKSTLNDCKSLIKKYNLKSYFSFHGYEENIIQFLKNNINAIVIPSQREAFGRVVLEGWASETPVIAFDCEGLSELIINEYNGILIKKNDIDLLTKSINDIRSDENLKNKLIFNGKESLKKFDIKYTAKQVIEIYNNI